MTSSAITCLCRNPTGTSSCSGGGAGISPWRASLSRRMRIDAARDFPHCRTVAARTITAGELAPVERRCCVETGVSQLVDVTLPQRRQ